MGGVYLVKKRTRHKRLQANLRDTAEAVHAQGGIWYCYSLWAVASAIHGLQRFPNRGTEHARFSEQAHPDKTEVAVKVSSSDRCVLCSKSAPCIGDLVLIIIIIMYIYHALINALSAYIHINLNMIICTHVSIVLQKQIT